MLLYEKLLTFRDTDKKFDLKGDLLKMITNKNYNAYLAESPDKKPLFEFAKGKYFDAKALGNIFTRDKSPLRLLQSPAIMAASLKTIFFENKGAKFKRNKKKIFILQSV